MVDNLKYRRETDQTLGYQADLKRLLDVILKNYVKIMHNSTTKLFYELNAANSLASKQNLMILNFS